MTAEEIMSPYWGNIFNVKDTSDSINFFDGEMFTIIIKKKKSELYVTIQHVDISGFDWITSVAGTGITGRILFSNLIPVKP